MASRTDIFTPVQRSAIMRAVPSKHSSAELKVRRLLTAMGLRYRLHRRDLPGSPDLVFASRRLAIFVHGCFWHRHDCRRGARTPKSNTAYWVAKIARNRVRDAAVRETLHAAGWRAETVWECELKGADVLAERLRALTSPPKQA